MFDHPTRRGFVAGAAAFSAWATIPKTALGASGRDPRFMALILRGGMDGLATVVPHGDPHYLEMRDNLAMPEEGELAAVPLDGFFSLNQRLPTLAKWYADGDALFVHAAHSPYRERSHFEAQDILENGTTSDAHFSDGWLGRALAAMPTDSRMARQGGFAAASTTPLVLRGASNIVTWLPAGLPAATADTRLRLMSLYEHTDPVLAKALAAGLKLEDIAGSEAAITAEIETMMGDMSGMSGGRRGREMAAAATAAGRAMSKDDGARVGFLDLSGFDTHRAQQPVNGALGRSLALLDSTLKTLREALGEAAWQDTVIAVITEFGRTVRFNGSNGTDHGMATVAMFVGGAVDGGRIIADWPGLSEGALYQKRDLQPTTDVRAVLKGALRDHLGIDGRVLGETVFPETADLRPMDGLIAGVGQRAGLR